MAEATLPFETAVEASRTHGYVSTGNYALNWAITGSLLRGGWPLGHAIEIYGDPSSGKSFLLFRALAQIMMASNGAACLDDAEGGLNVDWASAQLGVNCNELLLTQSDTVAEHHEVAVKFLAYCTKRKKIGVLGLDSLAVLTTDHESDTEFSKRDMMRAQEVRKHFRKIKRALRQSQVAYIITNHTIANIGGFSNRPTTPGGGGLKFHAGVRLELREPSRIKNANQAGEFLGVIVSAFVEKNRFSAPWRKVKMTIPFYEPLNPLSGLIPLLMDVGFLLPSGNRLMLHDGTLTGIFAHKTDMLKQDDAAEALMTTIPDLLEQADMFIADREMNLRVGTAAVVDDG